jgi:hypothetical protein
LTFGENSGGLLEVQGFQTSVMKKQNHLTAKSVSRSKRRQDLVGIVKTPLSFYVLALLIVESTLAIVLSCSRLNEELMIWVLGTVVTTVTGLVIFNPRNLLYGKEEHREPLLEPSALRDQIEDLIVANVKSECLQKAETPGKIAL